MKSEIYMKNLSIQYKLLFLLVSLPMCMLGLYLLIASQIFEKDKLSYIYDSSSNYTKSIASSFRSELELINAQLEAIIYGYNPDSDSFYSTSKKIFENDEQLRASYLYRPIKPGFYRQYAKLEKVNFSSYIESRKDELIEASRKNPFIFEIYNAKEKLYLYGFRFGELSDPNHGFFFSIVHLERMTNLFRSQGAYKVFLVNAKGKDLFQEVETSELDSIDFVGFIENTRLPAGTFEEQLGDQGKFLFSYSQVGLADLTVVTMISEDQALEAVEVLLAKSFLFFIALISFSVLVSVFASRVLVRALQKLVAATAKIAQGDFHARVELKGKDEVGKLAHSFNNMASKIENLLKDQIEKARMEKELETAKAVQETLFPETNYAGQNFELTGFYRPASECGGDWWFYNQDKDKIFIWIGDATGHGASAALVTSAARSASSIISMMPDISPAKAMKILNRSIYDTSKSKLMMTFFIASMDLKTGELTYCNASHDPPWIIPEKQDAPLKKKDLIPLNEVNNRRLGEAPNSEYDEVKIQIPKGAKLFFYTDGIMDFTNPEGQVWGERNFLKALIQVSESTENSDEFVQKLEELIEEFRQGEALLDDITMVSCKWRDSA